MATDPYEFLNKLNPLGSQRTQPTPTEVQQRDEPEEDQFDSAIERIERRKKSQETRRLQDTPEDQNRRNRIAKELGVPPSQITDLKFAERALAAKRQMEMREKYPAISKVFDDNPDIASSALNDEKELGLLGGAWDFISKMPGRVFETGSLQTAKMLAASNLTSQQSKTDTAIGIVSMFFPDEVGNVVRGASEDVYDAQRRATVEPLEMAAKKSRERYSSDNYIVEGLLQGGESVALTVAAAATRNPYVGAAVVGGVVGGDAVDEGRQKGLTASEAYLYGALQGAPEAAFEIVPMGKLLEIGGEGFVRGAAKYLAAEVPGEIATTVTQSFVDFAMLPENKDKTLTDWANSLPEAISQTVLGVIGGGTVTVTTQQGIMSAAKLAQRRALNRQRAAYGKFEGDFLDQIGSAAERSNLRSEDPEAFAKLMREMADAAGVSTVMVPGEVVREYMQSDSYKPGTDPLSAYKEQAFEAAFIGNDLVLPIEVALTNLPGTPAWDALKDDMRITAGGMSKREAQAYEEMLDQGDFAQFEASASKAEEKATAREAVVARLQERLETDAQFAPSQAKQYAELAAARILTRAARMGRGQDAVDQAVENYRVRMVMPPELARAVEADEREMVVDILRGRAQGSTSRARAAADELRQVLAFQGWQVDDLTDEQLGEVMERLQAQEEERGREYRADGRGSGDPRGKYAPLDGATKARGWHGPVAELVDVAERYAEANGIDLKRQAYFVTKDRFDEDFARRIAQAYEEMEHAPNDPEVRAAYEDLIGQTRAQYDALIEAGYSFTFFDDETDPYEGNPFNAMRDLRDNKTMAVYSSIAGYGSGYSETAVEDNPLLADTGLEWPDQNGEPVKVLANDLFRAVHDAFGHGLEGAGFRYDGEENAWQAHARLFTGPALAALTSETRGQNSWLNFGPRGEDNRTATLEDTTFADQKAGLLPEWAWTENVVPDMEQRDELFQEALTVGELAAETAEGTEIGWTSNRINDLVRAFGYASEPERTKAYAVRLSPDQFLGLTASARGRDVIQDRIENLEEYAGGEIDFDRMRDNAQPIFLSINVEGERQVLDIDSDDFSKITLPEDARVMGHEGRHRMTMLKKAGVTSVPVVILLENRNTPSGEQIPLSPQRSKSEQLSAGDTPTLAEGLEPISYANRERLAEVFGTGRELFQDGYERILEKQREVEGLRAAIRDPETGEIYTGSSHQGIINSVPTDNQNGLYGRLSNAWYYETDDAGFVTSDGTFITRDEANERYRILTMEDRADFMRDRWRRSYNQANIFYSALERAAENITTERAPAQQWIATLKKTPGVKQEELEWTGIIDWLQAQKGPVEKAAVISMIQQGGVEIREIELYVPTEEDIDPAHIEERIQDEENEFYDYFEPRYRLNEYDVEEDGETRTVYTVEDDGGTLSEHDDEGDAYEALDEANREQQDEAYSEWYEMRRRQIVEDLLEPGVYGNPYTENTVKWQDWSLSNSGTAEEKASYRELLITLPPGSMNNPEEVFEGTHHDEHEHEGIIAHARFFDAKGPNGERILFLDEIQSDWHQEGKKQGYNTKPNPADVEAAEAAEEEARAEWRAAMADLRELVLPVAIRVRQEANETLGAQIPEDRPYGDMDIFAAARGKYGKDDPAINAALVKEFEKSIAHDDAKEFLNAVEGGADPVAYKQRLAAWREAVEAAKPYTEDAMSAAEKLAKDLLPLVEAAIERARNTDDGGDTYAQTVSDRLFYDHVKRVAESGAERGTAQSILYSWSALKGKSQIRSYGETTAEIDDMANALDLAIDKMKQVMSDVQLRQQEFRNVAEGGAIPDAPFKDTWPALVMKRMTAWAAQGGYDQIAWIKQGENNGGRTNDDVEWFYGRNLPNMTNKFLKPYGAKVKPVRVEGRDAAPVGRITEIDAEIAAIKELPGGTQNYSNYGDNAKDATRKRHEENRAKLEEELRVEREVNIPFHQNAMREVAAAMERGDEMVRPEGLSYDVRATDDEINRHARRIVEIEQRIERGEKLLKATADFEEIWDRSRKVSALTEERKELARTAPTNLGFEITPELRDAASNGFPMFQRDHREAGPRGRILFPNDTDQGAVIELFQGRDLSTLIHESSHLWLEELKADAADPNAPEQLKRDWQLVLDWFKSNGYEVRDGIIPVGAHEMWARGGERYMREGKAPSTGLKRAFETFRQWLTSLYETVRGLRSPITPEIREVFDRLLATDAEIEEARQVQGMEALFDTAMEAGMSSDEFANYQEQVESARAEAQSSVLEKAMATINRREQRLMRERRKQVKDQMSSAVEERPLFKALAALREQRMDRETLIERFGEEVLGQLPTRVPPLYSQEGVDPEIIAELAGFNSAQSMVEAMVQAEAEQKAAKEGGDKRNMKARIIDQMTNAAMDARYGEPMTPEQMREEALDAVANDRQGEVIASEIRALSRKTGQRPTPYRLAREWARTRVRQGTYVAEASKSALQRHRRAIAAAGREAEQALIEQDMEAVYRAKQKQMLSSALLAEAKAAHEEVETARARMDRIAKARTMKSVDQDYLEQAHALLEAVDLKQRSQVFLDRQGSWAEWAAAREAEGYDIAVPESFEATVGTTNWTRLPVEQILGLDQAVKQVVHLGRHKQTLIDNNERREFEEIVAEAEAAGDKIGRKPPRGSFTDLSWWESTKQRVSAFDAGLLRMEQVFDWLDSNDPTGVFNRMVFQPIAEAQARQREMIEDYHRKLKDAADLVDDKTIRSWANRVSLDLIDPETGLPAVMERKRLIAMALNWGNEGNRQRLADGYGWSEQGVERALMENLTEDEWQYVQNVWDALEGLWPSIEKMERSINGVAPERVEPAPVNTPFGTLRGGYYPAVYDSTLDYAAEEREAKKSDLFSADYIRASTRSSATKSRAEQVKRPILLDLGVMTRHIGEVVHDVTHREAIMRAHKFLNNERVKRTIDETLGVEVRKQMQPWLNFIANSWANERAGNEGIGRFMGKLRANVTVVGMGWRFTTIMTQIAGYSNSFEMVGARWVAPQIAKFQAQMAGSAGKFVTFQGVQMPEMMAFALERSDELRFRLDTLDRDIRNEMDRVNARTPGKAVESLTAVKRFAFHGIGYMDRMVSVPTWMGAYNKALDQGLSEKDAAFSADKAVRLSQGAGAPKDLAAVSRGTGRWGEAFKLMTMFYTYLSAVYSRQRNLGRDIARASADEVPALMARAWFLIVMPPLLAELLSGRGPEEDEEWGWWAFQKMLSQSLGAIPVVRDLTDPVFDRLQGQRGFDYRLTPVQGAGQSILNVAGDAGRIVQGKETSRATRNVLEAVGYSTGLVPGQIAASTQFLVDVGSGDAKPDNLSEWYEGLTKGRIKED